MGANHLAEVVVEALRPLTQNEIQSLIDELTAGLAARSGWPRWIAPAELVRRVQPWLGMN